MGYTFVESNLDEVISNFARFDTFAFDLETTGLSPLDSRILLAQVGFPDEEAYVIDASKVSLEPLLPYLKSRQWKKIFFNGKFDEQFIIKNYDTPILNVWDCYISKRVIAPEDKWGNSFAELAELELGVKLDKSIRESFFGKKSSEYTEEQIRYAAEDVVHLFALQQLHAEKLHQSQSLHVAQLEFDTITVVSNMELEGVPINIDMWRETLGEYAVEHEAARRNMLSIFMGVSDFDQQLGFFGNAPEQPAGVKPLNINSPDQLKKAFARLGINVKNTKEQTIATIKHPAAEALLEYRGLEKIMTSYGENLLAKIHPFTGRLHADWKQVGTETGRFSCANPNLQQVPEKFREAIGHEKDYVLVGADFSQMELRILAEESRDPILVDAFTTGKDVHSVTASTMFNIPIDAVSKEQRFAAKTLNFGITYGMKVRKFKDMMNAENNKDGRPQINMRTAGAIIEKYRDTYQVAGKYLNDVGLQALRSGRTQTRFGRKRFFTPVSTKLDPDAFKGQIEAIKRQGANMPIQGTNADITKMAMIDIHEQLRDYGYRGNIILQVHDEIVVLAHKTQAEAIKPIVVEAMESAGQRLLPTIPVEVEAYVSEYWKK
jgi:DNA polymerase I-like protein with 3'-5' exonuclease and polymerase domains